MFRLSNRDHGLLLLDDIDLDAQLLAVRSLLSRNRQADAVLTEEIKALEDRARQAQGDYSRHLDNARVDELHGSVYQGAANSMAAAGMLAPLVESLFTALFRNIGARNAMGFAGAAAPDRRAHSETHYWDPHFVFGAKGASKDLVAGIRQLSAACGLEPYMPGGYGSLLKALFTYRNKMFHNGFEWPMRERAAFDQFIQQEGWPADWFDRATSGGEPWVFYMSDTLIELCLLTIDQVLEGAGAYVQDLRSRREATSA